MTPTAMTALMLTLKMGVAGGFGIVLLFGLNWFNNHEFKGKGNGGDRGDTNKSSDIRQKLASRG